ALELNSEDGFPHSEICGSKVAHTSPTLIAACHVLHRLCMPRHPPNALTSRLRTHTTNINPEANISRAEYTQHQSILETHLSRHLPRGSCGKRCVPHRFLEPIHN